MITVMRKVYKSPNIKIVVIDDCDIVTNSLRVSMQAYDEEVEDKPVDPSYESIWGKQW